jgi:hypothetical protein
MKHYFTARVELNYNDDGDYTLLHQELEKISFHRAILGVTKIWYDLPTGEYVRHSDNTLDEISNLLNKTLEEFIAKKPKNNKGVSKSFEYLLGKSEALSFLLKQNTDTGKRPKS